MPLLFSQGDFGNSKLRLVYEYYRGQLPDGIRDSAFKIMLNSMMADVGRLPEGGAKWKELNLFIQDEQLAENNPQFEKYKIDIEAGDVFSVVVNLTLDSVENGILNLLLAKLEEKAIGVMSYQERDDNENCLITRSHVYFGDGIEDKAKACEVIRGMFESIKDQVQGYSKEVILNVFKEDKDAREFYKGFLEEIPKGQVVNKQDSNQLQGFRCKLG